MQNRRQFLKGISFTALGATLTTSVASASMAIPSIAKASTKEAELFSETRLLMGTYVTLKAMHTSQDFVQEAFADTFLQMQKAEAILSRHDSASALSILNSQKTLKDIPLDLNIVAHEAQKIQTWSREAFNPSVLPVLEYLEDNALNNRAVSQEKVRALYSAVSKDAMLFSKNSLKLASTDTKITFDGIAKGYIVDKAATVLTQHGIQDFLINAGGDVRASGMKGATLLSPSPWRVAIEDPHKQANYPAIVPLYNCALATSGTYEKTFGANNHLIMPHVTSDMSISAKILSVSVKAETSMLADAMATALSCLPVRDAIRLCETMPNTACFIIAEDNKQYHSKKWIVG